GFKVYRRIDCLSDFAERTQLVDRLRKLLRALLDLVFQPRVGLLQPAGHVIELVGECLELIAGFDFNPLREVAATDSSRSGTQSLDRHNHPARKKYSGDSRKTERGEQNQSGTLNRGHQWLIGLAYRQLDKNGPAKRCNRCEGTQNSPPLQVG